MRKLLAIALLVFICFLAEFLLFNIVGRWAKPNLLILLIIFFNLAFGIRYSLVAAVLGGLLKESLSLNIFGFYLLPFVLCAYMTTVLRQTIYHRGSPFSRLLLVAIVIGIYTVTQYGLSLFSGLLNPLDSLQFVLAPELLITLIITPWFFHKLKLCVSKLFAYLSLPYF